MVGFPSDHEEEVYRLVKMYSESLIESKCNFPYQYFFLTKKVSFPKKAVRTRQEFVFL